MKKLIYVVEDDASLQELYTYTLENDFECLCFPKSKPFFKSLSDSSVKKPDLIILDVMLPDEDGFAILSRLKAQNGWAVIPVIMVSAKEDEISKVKGLNLGADDYIAKPFGVLELIARIKANLRKNISSENISFKDIFIDMSKHQITANSNIINATLKEYNLLMLLCKNPEKVQEREHIFSQVWGENFMGETRTLDIHVKELRKKLTEAGSLTKIKTIRGVGYMLT